MPIYTVDVVLKVVVAVAAVVGIVGIVGIGLVWRSLWQ